MREADGTLTFLCLEPILPRHRTNPMFADCQGLAQSLAANLRDTVASGDGWRMIRFDPRGTTSTSPLAHPAA